MPTISVIVPVYNVEKYLRQCIDSILAQTFTDFELILVNDGSTDRSGAICDEYAVRDKRIKVIHCENKGVSNARNCGIDAALGRYILFVDSDDHIDQYYLEYLSLHPADLTACGLDKRLVDGTILSQSAYTAGNYPQRELIDYPTLYRENLLYSPYCKLFKSEIIKKHKLQFPIEYTWGEDGMFVADYLQYTDSIIVLNYIGYHYMKYDGGITLSTSIRPDVVDMVAVTREYCAEKMRITSPKDYAVVRELCEEDIIANCAYFLIQLLNCGSLKQKQKLSILKSYMQNQYIRVILEKPDVYFSGNPGLMKSLLKEEPRQILNTYNRFLRKDRAKTWLYNQIYSKLPAVLQSFYRRLRNK